MSNQSLRHYYYFWAGQQVSSAGSAVVSFIIIWWITIFTGSAWYLALSAALSFGMMALAQLVAGYVTDFYSRKMVIGLVDGLQAVATVALVALFATGMQSITWVLALLAIRGLFDGFHRPATGAIIPSMVPQEELRKVNSLNNFSRSLISLASPPTAAMLLLVFNHQMVFLLLLDAITFVIALVPLVLITIPHVENQSSEPMWTRLLKGYSFLRSSQGLMPLLLIFASFNFFITPVSVLTPLIVLGEFSSNELVLGLVLSSFNGAMLLVSAVLSRVELPLSPPKGVMMGFSLSLLGLLVMAWGISAHQLLLFAAGEVIIGCSLPVVNVYSSVIWQSKVPSELQGRVISVRMIVVLWSTPLTIIAVGLAAELISLASLFLLSSFGFLIALLVIWLLTDFRMLSLTFSPHLPVMAD